MPLNCRKPSTIHATPEPSAPCRGYGETLRMGVLPVALFASGHTFFVQRLAERLGLDVIAVHATFQYSGTPGKRHRMRERQLWLAVRTPLLPAVRMRVQRVVETQQSPLHVLAPAVGGDCGRAY